MRQTAQGRSVLAPSVTQQLVQRAARPAQSLSAREIEILQGLATEQATGSRQRSS